MTSLRDISNPAVRAAFRAYPEPSRSRLLRLRRIVLDAAASAEGVGEIEETLKWGEPSYVARGGSTVRLGWKASTPDRCGVYFHCQTRLVDTFRELYPDTFEFEGNRAIVFHDEELFPAEQLRHCVALSLRYHRVKHLPLLGAVPR